MLMVDYLNLIFLLHQNIISLNKNPKHHMIHHSFKFKFTIIE